MKNLSFYLFAFFILSSVGCNKDDDENQIRLDQLNGFVQKGPFINGTSITISELSKDFNPTGRIFSTQIIDNKGTFEINNVELKTQYGEIKADGFYFNEVRNSNSDAQLTLSAISDLSDKINLNVNVITYLEKERVRFLLSEGLEFDSAKKQAQKEVLSIFELTKEIASDSESLNITEIGDENAVLLAISVILQGYLSVSDLSELLANISTDIREDGILNSQTLGSILINNAKLINLETIRANLENRYMELGMEVQIPDFEKYVNQFISSTDFVYVSNIEYPASISSLTNILSESVTEVYAWTKFCIGAKIPYGEKLKVICKPQDGLCNSNGTVVNYGWTKKSTWCDSTNLEAIGADQVVYVEYLTGPLSLDIEIYENDDSIPTVVKTIVAK